MPLPTLALVSAAVFGVLALSLQWALTLRHRRLARHLPPKRMHVPGVSILKPLCGVDDDLAGNLEEFAKLDYPNDKLEILLGVENVEDPAHAVATGIVRRHPLRFRIVVQNGTPGHNPKVNQLVTLERAAKHDLLVVSDSNTRVASGYVHEIAAALEDPRVGCVTHPVVGVGERRFGSRLDNFHLASSIGGGMIGSQLAPGKTLVVGKSMALRRSDLHALGGFAATCDHLAEDFVIGGWVQQRLKKRVFVGRLPVENVSRDKSLNAFFQRYRRWSVIHRTSVSLPTYVAQGLLNPAPYGVLTFVLSPSVATATFAAGIVLAKALLDIGHVALLRPAPVGVREAALLLACAPVKDALLWAAWLNGFVERRVRWRGKMLRVSSGSRLVGAALPDAPAQLQDEADTEPSSLTA